MNRQHKSEWGLGLLEYPDGWKSTQAPADWSWLRDDWYWYVALAAVVALGIGSAWL